MQKLLSLVALTAFVSLPALAAGAPISDEAKLQMASEQHVTVSPAEVDARIAQLRAQNVAMRGTDEEIRRQIVVQIAWEKTAH